MKLKKENMLLYAVTDRSWENKPQFGNLSLYEQVHAALRGGATCVQLREKNLDFNSFLAEAETICKLCRQFNVPFIVNDNVEIAMSCKADGIHVGQEDMAVKRLRTLVGDSMIIGVSAHNVNEAVQAQKDGADYLGLGAVFSTSTKTDVDNMSYDTLRAICSAVNIPTVAIGGISKQTINGLKGSGVDGVAVVSAIFASPDPEKSAKELRELSEKL